MGSLPEVKALPLNRFVPLLLLHSVVSILLAIGWPLSSQAIEPSEIGSCLLRALTAPFTGQKSPETLSHRRARADQDYQNAIQNLNTSSDRADSEVWIRKADQADRDYCDANNRIASKTGALLLVPLEHQYVGESMAKSFNIWRTGEARPILAGRPVHYFTSTEVAQAHVVFSDGKAYSGDGRLLRSGFGLEYVMDSEGEIFITADALRGKGINYHHSSFTNGRPVAAAGTISFDADGTITAISRDSGHYKPSKAQMRQFIHRLRGHGMELSRAEIKWNVQKF